jgi:hypothetical protein
VQFAVSDANASYDAIQAFGLANFSAHTHAGVGTNPPPDIRAAIDEWQTREKASGTKPVASVLDTIGDCLDETKFDAIGFAQLLTTPKPGENPNTCTGCNNAPCRDCHNAGDGGFFMAAGSNLGDNTFENTKLAKYIGKYITVNGTDPVPSHAIRAKSDATVTAAPYTHPMFKMSPTMEAALDAFVDDAITKYKAGTCGHGTSASSSSSSSGSSTPSP